MLFYILYSIPIDVYNELFSISLSFKNLVQGVENSYVKIEYIHLSFIITLKPEVKNLTIPDNWISDFHSVNKNKWCFYRRPLSGHVT